MDFDTAFTKVVGTEGNFGNDPRDPGNWTGGAVNKGALKGTKYGISAAAYPALDIVNLTLDQARQIYLRDYWGAAACDAVPAALKYPLFDTAVNSGVHQAVRLLQAAINTTADGVLGPLTLMAIGTMDAQRLVTKFQAQRLIFMTNAPGWLDNSRGWVRRAANILLEA